MATDKEVAMSILRAGLILFVSVSLGATAIVWGIYYLSGSNVDADSVLQYLLPFGAVALGTSLVLVILGRRGRRQPLGDGIITINVIVLAYCYYGFFVGVATDQSKYPDASATYALLGSGIFLVCLIPAYLICYLALCRTPLLRDLAPRTSKGLAKASP
jgi:hypothetical protein